MRLIAKLKLPKQVSSQDTNLPPAAILISLRGGDPFLRESLTRLIEQDYPDFHIHIIIDHSDDPAMPIVKSFIDEQSPGNVTVQVLSDRLDTCTLTNQSYAALVDSLDDRFQYVVTVDADAVT